MWCEYYIVLIFDILISRLLTLSNPKGQRIREVSTFNAINEAHRPRTLC